MPNFKKYNHDQSAMVVINFEEQLQPGTFEFTLHKLIDHHIIYQTSMKNIAMIAVAAPLTIPPFYSRLFCLLTQKASRPAGKSSGKGGIIVTANTGFSNEDNNQQLREQRINAYIPDNRFRSREKFFADQKEKYGKRHQNTAKGLKIEKLANYAHVG